MLCRSQNFLSGIALLRYLYISIQSPFFVVVWCLVFVPCLPPLEQGSEHFLPLQPCCVKTTLKVCLIHTIQCYKYIEELIQIHRTHTKMLAVLRHLSLAKPENSKGPKRKIYPEQRGFLVQ